MGDEGSVVRKNRGNGSDVRGGLEIRWSVMWSFKNDLEGAWRLSRWSPKNSDISLLDNALVGLKVVDATVVIAR